MAKQSKAPVCILVPTYNSDASLKELVEGLGSALSADYPEWQLVLVDDMSPSPSSWNTIENLNQLHGNISAIRLLKNRGRSIAAICGLNYIHNHFPASHVVIMDDDLQHRPEDAKVLADELISSPDVDVVVAQFSDKQTSLLNKFGSKLKSFLDHWYYGLPKNVRFGPFIAMNNRLVEPICRIRAQNPLLGSQILQIANSYKGIKCLHEKRRYGSPVFNFSRRLRLLLAIAFSDVSFLSKAFLLLGVLLCSFSILISLYFLTVYLFAGSAISGWLSLILAILFFGGINIFGLSVVFRNIALIKNTTDGLPIWGERDFLPAAKRPKQ